MKHIVIFSLIFLSVLCSSCDEHDMHMHEVYNTHKYPQEYVDNAITKSPVKIDGHDYWFFEVGSRGYRDYCFQLEHRVDCKECLDMFD